MFLAGVEGLEVSRCITDMMENIERGHSQTDGWREKVMILKSGSA